MLEVTGAKFWKPYKEIGNPVPQPSAAADGKAQSDDTPAGMSADLYQYRPPIDLANPRLRDMARALGPAYMRISGTWANTTYFADTNIPPRDPPQGYGGVLMRQQWLAAIDFSRAVDAPIVTSMPTGRARAGGRALAARPSRLWLAFTKKMAERLPAIEYMNEPTLASMGGAPKGYDAAAFGRDFRVFEAFMRKEYPGTKILAPGSVGEANTGWAVATGGYGNLEVLTAADLAASTGGADAFSYHHYGAVSQRCTAMGYQTSADQALSEDWLGRTDQTLAYYRGVRDKFMPGKPFWTRRRQMRHAAAIRGRAPFWTHSGTLDQLGRLARQQVDVVIHNTLVASDYGLLDEDSFEPSPTSGARCSGAASWERQSSTRRSPTSPACTCMRIACAACPAVWRFLF